MPTTTPRPVAPSAGREERRSMGGVGAALRAAGIEQGTQGMRELQPNARESALISSRRATGTLTVTTPRPPRHGEPASRQASGSAVVTSTRSTGSAMPRRIDPAVSPAHRMDVSSIHPGSLASGDREKERLARPRGPPGPRPRRPPAARSRRGERSERGGGLGDPGRGGLEHHQWKTSGGENRFRTTQSGQESCSAPCPRFDPN